MKHIHTKKSFLPRGVGLALLLTTLSCATPLIAGDFSFSGESNTIIRMRNTIYDKNLVPAYEYIRLNLTDNFNDVSGVSFTLGAWGRGDLADKSEKNRTDADLQYAYLTYRAPKNNASVAIGRQFITEGVASERIDGLFLRSEFLYGFGTSAFFGNSVITESSSDPLYKGGSVVYGTRLFQTDKKYYTVGVSALKGEQSGDRSYREEEGIDLWIRPVDQIDISGRSTYNSITDGWMEHSYAVTYSPISTLRFGLDYANVNFHDYLLNVTTPALSIFNQIWNENEKQTSIAASTSYTGINNLMIAADYKLYSYDQSGDASYFGGKASYLLPASFLIGGGFHRMQGDVDKLRYNEYRLFASKKLGKSTLTVDAINVNYDKSINDINNSYAITAAADYELNHKLRLGADVEYSKNPDFDHEARAIVKATYTFDTKFVAEGGTKSEK